MSATPQPATLKPSPDAGEHSDEVLSALGYSAERIAALLHDADLLAQQPAQQADALVAGDEMFLGVQADRSLPDLRFGVPGKPLVFLGRKISPGLAVVA